MTVQRRVLTAPRKSVSAWIRAGLQGPLTPTSRSVTPTVSPVGDRVAHRLRPQMIRPRSSPCSASALLPMLPEWRGISCGCRWSGSRPPPVHLSRRPITAARRPDRADVRLPAGLQTLVERRWSPRTRKLHNVCRHEGRYHRPYRKPLLRWLDARREGVNSKRTATTQRRKKDCRTTNVGGDGGLRTRIRGPGAFGRSDSSVKDKTFDTIVFNRVRNWLGVEPVVWDMRPHQRATLHADE